MPAALATNSGRMSFTSFDALAEHPVELRLSTPCFGHCTVPLHFNNRPSTRKEKSGEDQRGSLKINEETSRQAYDLSKSEKGRVL